MSLSVDIRRHLAGFDLDGSFEVADARETLALLGPSGCGKSMTLKCVAGIVTPDEGRIVLNDRVLFDSAAGVNLRPQERRVGYLFQSYALFPNMTVEQNVGVGVLGASKEERAARVAEQVRAFRLDASRRSARRSSPAASSSASPWPASWPASPSCCFWTSPSRRSTGTCAGSLSWSSPTRCVGFPAARST